MQSEIGQVIQEECEEETEAANGSISMPDGGNNDSVDMTDEGHNDSYDMTDGGHDDSDDQKDGPATKAEAEGGVGQGKSEQEEVLQVPQKDATVVGDGGGGASKMVVRDMHADRAPTRDDAPPKRLLPASKQSVLKQRWQWLCNEHRTPTMEEARDAIERGAEEETKGLHPGTPHPPLSSWSIGCDMCAK